LEEKKEITERRGGGKKGFGRGKEGERASRSNYSKKKSSSANEEGT